MAPVIDFHTHVFPKPWSISQKWDEAARVRNKLRQITSPWSSLLHRTQPFLRHLPPLARNLIEEVAAASLLPQLAIESSAADLLKEMENGKVDQALLIAHPPWLTNSQTLQLAEDHPSLIAAVQFPAKPNTLPDADTLNQLRAELAAAVESGARALKIHCAADGCPPEHTHYAALLAEAEKLRIPVILHTGEIRSHLLHRRPELGQVTRFEEWFKKYPKVSFVLAHLNIHQPDEALDLAETYEHLFVTTSWQPTEVIIEAVRRIGADRILMASDWPFLGGNIAVAIDRIQDGVRMGSLTPHHAEQILGVNAARLLRLETTA